MSARDPFLNSFITVLDRALVWVALTFATFVVVWEVLWERGLGLPWALGLRELGLVFMGESEPVTRTLFALTLAVAMLSTSWLSTWLFSRWRRQGELSSAHIRGPRMED